MTSFNVNPFDKEFLMETDINVLQGIIGTDKKNPCLSLLRDEETGYLHLFYGLEQLQIIVEDKEHINFKVVVGMLYNAGLNRKKLCETFKVDRKTMQKWGQALAEKDKEKALKMFRGRGPTKLTVDVVSYVITIFPYVYERNKKSYSKEIRADILKTFQKKISSEGIRLLLKKCKSDYYQSKNLSREKSEESPTDDSSEGG